MSDKVANLNEKTVAAGEPEPADNYTRPPDHKGWAFDFSGLMAPDRPELYNDVNALNSPKTPNRSEILIKWFKRTLIEQPADCPVAWRTVDPAKVPLVHESRAVLVFMDALYVVFPSKVIAGSAMLLI